MYFAARVSFRLGQGGSVHKPANRQCYLMGYRCLGAELQGHAYLQTVCLDVLVYVFDQVPEGSENESLLDKMCH